jgi:hypothetical protein
MKDSLSRSVMARKLGVSFVTAIPTLHDTSKQIRRANRFDLILIPKKQKNSWLLSITTFVLYVLCFSIGDCMCVFVYVLQVQCFIDSEQMPATVLSLPSTFIGLC